MPYIKQELKDNLAEHLDALCEHIEGVHVLQNPGVLNYTFTKILLAYLKARGLNYQTLNDISGALTECRAEFRRRVVIPYEIKKAQENGDVY